MLQYLRGVILGFCAVGYAVSPSVAFAAAATPEAILQAVSGATDAGLCTEQVRETSSDCIKKTVRCDGATAGVGWKEYVEQNFEQVGGTVQPRQIATTVTSVDVVSRQFIEIGAMQVAPTDALTYLRADWARNSTTPPGPIQKGTCYCACGQGERDDVCGGKEPGFPIQSGDDLTYEECAAVCGPRQVAAEKCFVQPLATTAEASAAAVTSFKDDAFCFTPSECAQQNGIFEEHTACRDRGRCYAAEPSITLQVPIGNITEIQGFSRYLVAIYRYGISATALVATVMFVYGAFRYLVGSGIGGIERGKTIMQESIIGMIFVFAATMILRTINPATTQLDPLKVYMVNNRQFVSVAQCSDLGPNVRVALAGTRPALTPYASVVEREGAFNLLAPNTDCGSAYWIDAGTESSCDGMRCPGQGQVCLSCSDPSTPGCNGLANDRRVCVRTVFAGTVDYTEGKFPTNIEVFGVCNFAQNDTDVEAIEDSLFSMKRTGPERVGRRAEGRETDADETGRASYRLDFDEDDITTAMGDCEDRGGFRGALLGVVYEEPLGVNDIAMLSPLNCRASQFNGYANGTDGMDAVLNITPFAKALMCGVRNGNFQDVAGQYWTEAQLRAAARGEQPIICDITLTDDTAPDDPADSLCR